jgi:hypothetical protein
MNNESECFTLFSSVWISQWNTRSRCSYITSQMNRDVTECFRLLIWIEFLTKHNVMKTMKTLVTFIKFHWVIQMASCDQIGDYHWLNCSWIINEFENIIYSISQFKLVLSECNDLYFIAISFIAFTLHEIKQCPVFFGTPGTSCHT